MRHLIVQVLSDLEATPTELHSAAAESIRYLMALTEKYQAMVVIGHDMPIDIAREALEAVANYYGRPDLSAEDIIEAQTVAVAAVAAGGR